MLTNLGGLCYHGMKEASSLPLPPLPAYVNPPPSPPPSPMQDPTNPKFAVRCESNPALYNRCNCLWFGKWNRSSLRLVPR